MLRSLISKLIPVRLRAAINYHRYPHMITGFGGPLNGQCGRQQLFIDLLRTVRFTHIIETGAYRGTTTEYFARESKLPTYSVESDVSSYHYAKRRLRGLSNVFLSFGDSRPFLKRVLSQSVSNKDVPFVYLDAHWQSDLPLREEVEIVTGKCSQYVIMIDDFHVPDDGGYEFDSYEADNVLRIEYLRATIAGLDCDIGYPRLPSSRESGLRRGCIIIFAHSLAAELGKIPSLRSCPRSSWAHPDSDNPLMSKVIEQPLRNEDR